MVTALLGRLAPKEAYLRAIRVTRAFYEQPPYSGELAEFTRIFSGELLSLRESEIRSSGYVIDTLEASIWCFCNTNSYEEAVLRAVNLGEDTDTTATVAGGLAGVAYGPDAIPSKWLAQLARRIDLEALFYQFAAKVR